MATHASLTGAELHEPKGVEAASVDTVYVANGSGSGAWAKVGASQINTSSIFNVNKDFITVQLADVSTASAVLVPISRSCTLTKVTSVINNAITAADAVISVSKTGGTSIGTFTIANSGSAEGTIDEFTPTLNNTLVAGNWVKIATDGASSTTAPVTFLLEFTLT
jgi:hypothetical protein